MCAGTRRKRGGGGGAWSLLPAVTAVLSLTCLALLYQWWTAHAHAAAVREANTGLQLRVDKMTLEIRSLNVSGGMEGGSTPWQYVVSEEGGSTGWQYRAEAHGG